MTYKNSVKITTNNFSLCWKQLVWMLISILIVVGVALLCATPVINMLKKEGFFAALNDSFETLYSSPKTYPSTVTSCFKMFWKLISNHANTLWPSYIGALATLILVGNVFVGIGHVACSCVLSSRMTSNSRTSYTNRLFASLGKSISYSLVHFVFSIPFLAVVIGMFALYAHIARTSVITVALLPVISVIAYVVLALHLTLTCCMIPIMVDGQKNPFKALGLSMKEVKNRFARTFSSSLLIVLTIVFGNLFVGFFTIFAGLFITLPATVVLLCSFGMVTHFAAKGQNFYVSDLVVVNLK